MVSIPFTTLNFQAERHTSSFALETVAVYKFSIWLYPTPSDIGALREAVMLIHLASTTVLLPEPELTFTSFFSPAQLLLLSGCDSHMVTDDPRCHDSDITSITPSSDQSTFGTHHTTIRLLRISLGASRGAPPAPVDRRDSFYRWYDSDFRGFGHYDCTRLEATLPKLHKSTHPSV